MDVNDDSDKKAPGGAVEQTLTSAAAKSALWSSLSVFGAQLLSICGTAVLARFLHPSDFGVMGLVGILTGLVVLIGNFGLGAAIIYRQDIDNDHIATSYWFNIAIGATLTGLTALSAPFAAKYFHDPMVKPVAIVLSLNFFINSFSWAHGCLLMKELQFKRLAFIKIGTVIVRAVVAITLAVFFEAGIWALVIGDLTMNATGSVARFLAHPWRPSFTFRWRKFRELFRYGINLTGASVFDYLSQHIDVILIGRLLDSTQLGYYQFSYGIPHFLQTGFTQSLNRVLFPVYCRVQDDNSRFGRGYLKTLRLISLLTVPALLGLAIVAGPFVRTLYGDRWEPVIIPMQILCFSAIARSILATNGAVLNAKGRPDISFWWSVARLPITFGITYLGYALAPEGWKVSGIGVGVTVASYASILPAKLATRLIDLPFRKWLSALWPATLCAGAMAALLLAVKQFLLPPDIPDIPSLIVLVPLGAGCYFMLFRALYRADFDAMLQLTLKTIMPARKR